MSAKSLDTIFVGDSEVARLMRQVDWAATAIGPADGWPKSVQSVVRLMLTSRYAMWMGWGPDLTFFYNDAYAQMTLGAKHPSALGRPAGEVWREIWPDVQPRIDGVLSTGQATWDEGLLLFLERSGFTEETYHTFSYSPLHGDDARVIGNFCVVTEDTTRVIGERRLTALRDLGARLASTQTSGDVISAARDALSFAGRDLPFSLIYLFEETGAGVRLATATQVEAGSPIAPHELDVVSGPWQVQAVLDGAPRAIVERPRDTVWPSGPWDRAPERAIVVPIAQPGQARAAGLLIAGLNPYRPVDDEYLSFINLFVGQLAAGLANARAYTAERRRAEALAQLDRAKTTFFSNVSHELRTPLTLIMGPVGDALASSEHSLDGDALALVYRNGLRLRKLVNALLDFSRLEAGRMRASFEPVDLGRLTAGMASAFQPAVERAGLRFTVNCAGGGHEVYVDREMWEKVVLNLLSNAFKFTMDGEIAVSVAPEGPRMAVTVRDTGAGIPAEELPRIFDRFHRVEGARGRTLEGTGIGLALVQELVRLHGGTIDAESEPGRGTAFTIRLPLGAAHLPAEQVQARAGDSEGAAEAFLAEAGRWVPDLEDDAAPEAGGASGAWFPDGGAGPRSRIVLADDNGDMRTYLAGLLGRHHDVTTASDGHQAFARARELRPDLVISDVMMPGLDGFGLLRELRADDRTRSIPVMLVSARAGEEARIEGFEAGADDYVVKPFTARELLARVEAQLLRAQVRTVEQEQRRRVAEVFTHAPVAVAILRGPAHIFELANPLYQALLHHRDVLGKPLLDALPELRGQDVPDRLDAVYRTGVRFIGRSYRAMLARGHDEAPEERFFDFVYEPTRDRQGAIDGIAVVAFDVTDLAQARKAAEDASRTKDEFLAMLGHELRNPLAPILTALQLLRLRGIEAGERERTIIERQVRHLVGLVDDLLDVSRIARGKVRLNPQPVEISEVVAKSIEVASPLLEQHQHDLVVDVPRLGLGVNADPARLAQVFSNLLTNAAKYTPPNGRITMTASREGDSVAVSVRDSGIGIEPQMLPQIFDLFTQDRQALDRAHGGLGLGLALVRSFVTLHGGTVTAESAGEGRGSEFVVRLPFEDVAPDAPAGDGDSPRAVVAGSGLRVLIVDDNADAGQLLAEALAMAGHETHVAYDGPSALAAAAGVLPHVALLDIGLPVMDGFELARRFRAHPDLRGATLVAVTGYGQDHDRKQSASAGFDAHLVKPVDIDELIAFVDGLKPGPSHGAAD